jgi:hypothetical protein
MLMGACKLSLGRSLCSRPHEGKFLGAKPFVKELNWANGIDKSGRPILAGREPPAEGNYICPGIDGATNC